MQSTFNMLAAALLGIGAVVVLGLIIHFVAQSAQAWRATLERIADTYDLDYSPGSWLRKPSAIGMVDGMDLTVDTITQRSGDSSVTYYRVLLSGALPDLRLSREGMGSFMGKLFKGEDLQIGDAWFDDRVVLRGDERTARALLDAETRDQVVAAVNEGITVGDHQIEWRKSGGRDQVPQIVDQVIALAQRLNRPVNAAALAHVARTERAPMAFKALTFVPPGAERDALDREMLAHQDPEMVLYAARRLGAEGIPAVSRLAVDRNVADALRADGLQWLQRHGDAESVARRCLDRPQVAAVALAVLDRAEPPVELQVLELLAEADDPSLTQQALRHACRHGSAAEPFLLTWLAREGAQTARVAAAGLAQVGTTAAVMPLREKIDSLGLFEGDLKSAALAAIESIQGRVGTAGGALSVVDESGGGLSEA